jgi:homoserine kinase
VSEFKNVSGFKATAFAPATVANVAVGFDILGFSVDGVGDEVTVSVLNGKREVEITEITGIVTELPRDASKNTASVALSAMVSELGLTHGFSVAIKKGIAMSSGMGGSAASSVAAVVAANEVLIRSGRLSLSKTELLHFSLLGEAAASGAIHGDNVGPCLVGGLTLLLPTKPMQMIPIPVPSDIFCVLVHPELKIETRAARGILKKEIEFTLSVEQSAWLGGFLAGCFRGDLEMIRVSMRDAVVEPQRSQLIPGFSEMKSRAAELGALGFSISGSGPSVFAWTYGKKTAIQIAGEIAEIFKAKGIMSQSWISEVAQAGARVTK